MPESGVRLARVPDADGIGTVNADAWRQRYAGILPDAALAALVPSDLAVAWAGAVLAPPTARHRLLVAVDDDVVVGYVAVGPAQDPDAEDSTGELIALEVSPAHARQGHGSRLLTAAVEHAQADGFAELVMWCPLSDEVRRGFVQSAGWGPDSAYRDVLVGQDADGEDLLVREVRLVAVIG
jgi:ribosomal protein S18 acetylase RimI-like enzyme